MNYQEMKDNINELQINKKIKKFKGFKESKEYENFETVYELIDKPNYMLMQFRDSEKYNTSKSTWLLCLPKDEKIYVIDMGTEKEVCEQFFNLIEIFARGFGTAKLQKK